MRIYVEIWIHGSIDELWEKTQRPELHQRWDARFTSITYLPRASESEPQRFRYSTRIGCGLAIDGAGETTGNRHGDDGRRTSALRFWSDDWKSLIREGAGYWQYIPKESAVRFITTYDYQTRFGWPGRIFDRIVFRPFLGWATAWSFDRLRLWIERGIDPALSMQHSLVHALSRISIALVWIYQGLVPKLIAAHADELAILRDSGITATVTPTLLFVLGFAEVMFGMVVLTFWHRRWPLQLTMMLMVLAAIAVAATSPRFLVAAFNPISLNFLVFIVAWIGLLVMNSLPSSGRCLRANPEKE